MCQAFKLIWPKFFVSFYTSCISVRVIEWSLRAFASMRALRFILRARAIIKFVLRAAGTL